jgi:hypothetical protein
MYVHVLLSYAYIYIYVYVYIYTCIYIYTRVYIPIYICIGKKNVLLTYIYREENRFYGRT